MIVKSYAKHFLLFVLASCLAHAAHLLALWLLVIPNPRAYDPIPLWWWLFILLPVCVIPVVFGFDIKSWPQFAAYALAAILMWQGFIVVYDWLWQRAYTRVYVSPESWFEMKLRQVSIPLGLVGVGALLGWLVRRGRAARS